MEWRGDDPSGGSPIDHVPAAPRAPSPRARALVFRYQGAQLVLLIVGLIFSFIGLILGSFGGWCFGLIARQSGPGLFKDMIGGAIIGIISGIVIGNILVKVRSREGVL